MIDEYPTTVVAEDVRNPRLGAMVTCTPPWSTCVWHSMYSGVYGIENVVWLAEAPLDVTAMLGRKLREDTSNHRQAI